MDKAILKDIIEWDVVNWSKAIDFWDKNVDLNNKKFNCLELGGRNGGLSLWLAIKGNYVICSDLESPENSASLLHKKYDVNSLIQYQAIDATNIPYKNQFDVVIFKSILGGISRGKMDALKKKTLDEIYHSLKANGVLFFAENIEASFIHKLLRKLFVKWGKDWNYLKINEIDSLFSSFSSVQYIMVGFFGAFGRTEKQRTILGRIDRIAETIIPGSKRYILIGIAKK